MEVQIVFVISILTLSNALCPPPEAIFPCSCNSESLTCPSPTYTQLQRVFTTLRTYPGGRGIKSISISDYTSSYLPGGQLTGVELERLDLDTSAFQSFHDRVTNKSFFEGIEDAISTIMLTYHKSYSDNFKWSSLSPARRLNFLSFKGLFTAIAEPFPKLPTVKSFWFNAPVSYMVNGALEGLTGVTEMRIVFPEMKHYKRNMFPRPAADLTMWTVTSDKVTELPFDYFEDITSLTYVEIPRNVNSIPPLTSSSRTYLQGSFNLTCDCKLGWMAKMQKEKKIYANALCVRPDNVKYREFKTITEADLKC